MVHEAGAEEPLVCKALLWFLNECDVLTPRGHGLGTLSVLLVGLFLSWLFHNRNNTVTERRLHLIQHSLFTSICSVSVQFHYLPSPAFLMVFIFFVELIVHEYHLAKGHRGGIEPSDYDAPILCLLNGLQEEMSSLLLKGLHTQLTIHKQQKIQITFTGVL